MSAFFLFCLSLSSRRYLVQNSLDTPPKPPTDIEDLCDICSPFPSTPSTTLYPMKAIKKKAREEETAVCVLEWRYPEEKKKESEWLVVKRPEKGEFFSRRDSTSTRPRVLNVSVLPIISEPSSPSRLHLQSITQVS